MRFEELLRLVWINVVQNKFKVVLTSIGIVVGSATIVMVLAIGKGGQMDVAEQFKNLNAGAIDISYEKAGGFSNKSGSSSKSGSAGNSARPDGASGGDRPSENNEPGGMPEMGGGTPEMGGGFSGNFVMGGNSSKDMSERMNKQNIVMSDDDVDNIEVFVPDISAVTISYSTRASVDGGELDEATSYTIAGVKSSYEKMSNLELQVGEFITDSNDENKEKVCVIGASLAKEIFGSAVDAYDSIIYIDSRPYLINGVLEEMGTVSSGISPDEAIFIPYNTGVKYITGTNVSPTITVIAEDVNNIDAVISNIKTVLAETYSNADFTITDAGSKMEAASESNNTLTMLLISMAVIVFIVGGIGIMNVLFVSVKERTNEIGILKALGCTQKDILMEFLCEAAVISLFGGIIGVVLSIIITPLIEILNVRVELTIYGGVLAVVFAVVTGTIFGFYPAWKASRLVPVDALNEE